MNRSWCTLLLLLAGCGPPQEATVPVAGKVLVDGQPLTAGTVIFTPDTAKGNTSLHEPRGKLDGQGVYHLFLTKQREGAPPGWYKISLSAQRRKDANDRYSYVSVLPAKYADPEESGLALQVVAKPGPGAYDLTLTTKGE